MGAKTLVIPFVETAEDARAAVSAAWYPPQGKRGVAGLMRASGYGTRAGYHANANAEVCVLIQVETEKGMQNLREIATVDGVDGIFIGPSDLAASMGHLGDHHHPNVQAAIADAVKTLSELGVPAGILATDAADARRYADMGFKFIAAGVDIGLLMGAAKTLLKDAKRT
jgi:4-hydroxy-2-oxoheptanedioate aldolase